MWTFSTTGFDYIHHVGSLHDCSAIIKSGLFAGQKDAKEGRQTVRDVTEKRCYICLAQIDHGNGQENTDELPDENNIFVGAQVSVA